jgi:DNA mismatch repair protein MutS2
LIVKQAGELNLTNPQKTPPPFDQNRADESLEWSQILEILRGFAQTVQGQEDVVLLQRYRDHHATYERWRQVDPIKSLAKDLLIAPIGQVPLITPLLKAAQLGQILDGSELRSLYLLLESTQRVYQFTKDFAGRAPVLLRIKGHLLPLPKLAQMIAQTVGPDGSLLDDASPELTRIRRLKMSIRRRIEESMSRLMQDLDIAKYLQDQFWTVRSERYVLPIRIDGRGRVRGSILDTSDSGQTLFIEPASIAPVNDQLLEMDIEEKLEIARIFRELSLAIAQDAETLAGNYQVLLQLDLMTAEARLAADIDAGPVVLVDHPTLHLVDARHPLIRRSSGRTPVGNTIDLSGDQTSLVVSGPNAGGKTVILKTVGLLHKMLGAGLLIPADPQSKMYLFDRIFVEMGDHQDLAHNLSTFSGHLMGLKPIIDSASQKDLVLLDELAVGTDPETGAAFAAALLEDFADRKVMTLATTHFDALKGLALKDSRFRNGSMEFSLQNLRPTYRLILDVPGQSYGLEVAEQIGLPQRILESAKRYKQGGASDLNRAVSDLMLARDQARNEKARVEEERVRLEGERLRWEQEIALLKENRHKVASQLKDQYESQLSGMRREFEEVMKTLRQQSEQSQAVKDSRQLAEQSLKKMSGSLSQLNQDYESTVKLPGESVEGTVLKEGESVYVMPLKKQGSVLKMIDHQSAEVKVGVIKLRVPLRDLRRLSPGETPPALRGNKKVSGPATYRPQSTPSSAPAPSPGRGAATDGIPFVVQTHLNTLDLRGMAGDEAERQVMDYLDRALLRGEEFVILLHGHGEGVLKIRIREALKVDCPYDIDFRPGLDQEGGDGVTVVRLQR